MSKADEPAFPLPEETVNLKLHGLPVSGLTKREYVATHMAQGIMGYTDALSALNPSEIAQLAVECTNALLAALERKPE